MKIAICMSGGLRCFKETFKFTERFLFSQLDCDLFFYGVENKEGVQANIDDFFCLYNPKKFIINHISYYDDIVKSFEHNFDKKTNVISMYYNIFMCNMLRQEYAKENNINYDVVIRLRPDCFFFKSIPNKDFDMAFDDYLIIPECWSFSGLSDLFAISNESTFNTYSDVFNHLKSYFSQNIFKPESILKHHCDKHNTQIHLIENYMRFEFPDIMDHTLDNITFNNAVRQNLKYSYDKSNIV